MQYSIFVAQNRLIYNHKFRPTEGFIVLLTLLNLCHFGLLPAKNAKISQFIA